ncbi:MAG: HlyD family efflux transporter periplasmic adaptor subunit [Lentisphaerae bacterium]|jgi:multidrug resistance efflux pump|nr:HlyD family efflux transporter periplasmic adaptor subunit [Lentisphaerota bacterium]MBT5604678.1 HlyD family efflux transporter periplasmic adaptor subunit [Lentisphaerota bacterium]MBT7053822.1 HlyD family efflux transporter periplasmic adaptor subunit [Lentisphaerota bacterium]MBT7847201.1 HlyD family efflux transporter periplasmic adaptor subunit [Lentisphaerota bacterium]
MGDFRTTKGESLPLPRKQRRRKRLVWATFFLVLIAGIVYAGFAIRVPSYVLSTGYVTTERYAEVRPAAVGTVAEIVKRSGNQVEKGEVMVRLDASEIEASLEEARSRVNKVKAQVARRRAEIEELKRKQKESIAIAKLRLRNMSAKLTRTQELVAKGLKAASALDDEKLKEELSRAELASLLNKDQTIYEKELAVMHQDLEAASDSVKRIETQRRAREIRAPIDGEVLRYEFVIGELVRPETVLYEIFGGTKKVLKLRVAERYATRVTTGQRYEAELTPYRGLQKVLFGGEVTHLRSVIQAEGQKTYRVAYCTFNSDDWTLPAGKTVADYDVPPGTSAEAKIFYGESYLWFYLFNLD